MSDSLLFTGVVAGGDEAVEDEGGGCQEGEAPGGAGGVVQAGVEQGEDGHDKDRLGGVSVAGGKGPFR